MSDAVRLGDQLHPQDLYDAVIGKVNPRGQSIKQARMAAEEFNRRYAQGMPAPSPGAVGPGGLWYLDIETLGLDPHGPVHSAAFVSQKQLRDLAGGRKLSMELMRQASDNFDQLVMPTMVINGRPVPLNEVPDDAVKQLKRSITESIGAGKVESMLRQQLQPRFVNEWEGLEKRPALVEHTIDRMRDSLISDPTGKGLGAIINGKISDRLPTYTDVFVTGLRKMSAEGGGTLMVHNLDFEMRMLATRMGERFEKEVAPLLYQTSLEGFGPGLPMSQRQYTTSTAVSNYKQLLRSRQTYAPEKTYETAHGMYKSIMEHIAAPSHGSVKLIDTRDIFESIMTMAEGKGYLTRGMGVSHGTRVEDWLLAYDKTLREIHRPGADIAATEHFANLEWTKQLVEDIHSSPRRAVEAKWGGFLQNLDEIRRNASRKERSMIETISEHIANSLTGQKTRVVRGQIMEGMMIPDPGAYERAVATMMPEGVKRGATVTARGGSYDWRVLSADEIFALQWGRLGSYYQKEIGTNRFASMKETASQMLAADSDWRVQAAKLLTEEGPELAAVRLRKKVYEELSKSKVPMGTGIKPSGKGGYIAGIAIGTLAAMAIRPGQEQMDATAAEFTGDPNRPWAQTAVGLSVAAAGLAYAGQKGVFKYPGSVSKYGGQIAAAAFGAYSAIAGIHDILNDPTDPDMGGGFTSGLIAGGFAIGSTGRKSIMEGLDRWMGKNGKGKGTAVALALGAAVTGLGVALFGPQDRDEITYESGMRAEGFKAPLHADTDFGSPYRPGSTARLGKIIRDLGMNTKSLARTDGITIANKLAGQARGVAIERVSIKQAVKNQILPDSSIIERNKHQVQPLDIPVSTKEMLGQPEINIAVKYRHIPEWDLSSIKAPIGAPEPRLMVHAYGKAPTVTLPEAGSNIMPFPKRPLRPAPAGGIMPTAPDITKVGRGSRCRHHTPSMLEV